MAGRVARLRKLGASLSISRGTRLPMNEQRWRGALLLMVLLGSAIAPSDTAWPVLFPDKSWPALLPYQYP